jgi:hypothetical protein
MKEAVMKSVISFALCLMLILGTGLTAFAGGERYNITITAPDAPQAAPAGIIVMVEDIIGEGFTRVEVKIGDNGAWQDVTGEILAAGYVQLEAAENGTVYVSVTDPNGSVHIKSLDISCFTAKAATAAVLSSEAETAASVTPTDGSGTVLENSVKTPGEREFFTIQTAKGNNFYLVVDKEKPEKNVYLLAEVTEESLMGLTSSPDAEAGGSVSPFPLFSKPEQEQPEQEQQPAPAEKTGGGTIFVVIIVVVIAGGAGYYFKIVRPRQNAGQYDDEEETEEFDGLEDDEYDSKLGKEDEEIE